MYIVIQYRGSINIDFGFESKLESIFGTTIWNRFKKEKSSTYGMIMTLFEEIKNNYDPNDKTGTHDIHTHMQNNNQYKTIDL